MKQILRHLEIYLSLAGLAVIFGVTFLLRPFGYDSWTVAAITASSVGVLHGMIFWLVRRRQHAVRLETIREIQHMLKDMINNQLTVIQTMSHMHHADPVETAKLSNLVNRSVGKISMALQDLSNESLQQWKKRYGLLQERVTDSTAES